MNILRNVYPAFTVKRNDKLVYSKKFGGQTLEILTTTRLHARLTRQYLTSPCTKTPAKEVVDATLAIQLPPFLFSGDWCKNGHRVCRDHK